MAAKSARRHASPGAGTPWRPGRRRCPLLRPPPRGPPALARRPAGPAGTESGAGSADCAPAVCAPAMPASGLGCPPRRFQASARTPLTVFGYTAQAPLVACRASLRNIRAACSACAVFDAALRCGGVGAPPARSTRNAHYESPLCKVAACAARRGIKRRCSPIPASGRLGVEKIARVFVLALRVMLGNRASGWPFKIVLASGGSLRSCSRTGANGGSRYGVRAVHSAYTILPTAGAETSQRS